MTKDQKMKNNVRIQTAESCGVIRAAHFLHGKRPLVFEDAVAFELLGPDGRERSIAEKEMGLGGGAAASVMALSAAGSRVISPCQFGFQVVLARVVRIQ